MNTKNLVIVATIAAVLVGATTLTTADSAFAGKKGGDYSQATSQTNACGNGEAEFDRGMGTDTFLEIPIGAMNVGCQNTDSQIQGDENGVAQTAQQTFDD